MKRNQLVLALASIAWLNGGMHTAHAAKPAVGGGGDSTPPGAIGSLTYQTAARGISLKFVVPGDDGMSGRAAGYDVYYREGVCENTATQTSWIPPDTSWVLAPRSAETTAYTAGSFDFFPVHAGVPAPNGNGDGLQAGTPYCIAIRARDEKPNYGPTSFIDVETQGGPGDWPLDHRFRVADQRNAYSLQFAFPSVSAAPIFGWLVADPRSVGSTLNQIEFAGVDWRTALIPSDPIAQVQSFRMVAIPDGTGRVGAVLTGRSNIAGSSTEPPTLYYQMMEAGPYGVEIHPIVSGREETGGIAPIPDGGITYVEREGANNPVVTIERIIERTTSRKSSFTRTQLQIGERIGGIDGQWNWESTGLERTDGYPGFVHVEPFTKADGTLGFVAPHCSVLIYAERHLNGWRYWDAGPVNSSNQDRYVRVGFDDQTGAPILARRSRFDGVVQITRPDLTRTPMATPIPSNCTGFATTRPNAWEDVLPSDATGDLSYVSVSAVTVHQGHTFLATGAHQGHGKLAEQRLVYRCAGATDWASVPIDRTNGSGSMFQGVFYNTGMGPLVVDGRIQRAYDWGTADHAGSGTGGTNEFAYRTLPGDFVVLGSQPMESFCP